MKDVVLVCLGGAFGSGLRHLVGVFGQQLGFKSFPWATVLVNVLGSLGIGLVYALAVEHLRLSESTRLLLSVGVMGGLTTYSTYALETLRMVEGGAPLRAVVYGAVTLVGSLAACTAGLKLGRVLAS